MLRFAFEREEQAMRVALAELDETGADGAAIEARLGPLLGSARGRFLFLEGGGMGGLLARLREVAKVSMATKPSRLLPWCRLLGRCCADEESAVALGLLGGHGLVKRLMEGEAVAAVTDDEQEMEAAEAVAECAAEIASRCSLVRGGFPLRTLALCEVSTREALQLPVRMTFDTTDGKGGGGIVALLTSIGDRRMGGQADTGYVNWPAATILTRWLALHPETVAGKAVMEVGAGLGLCGLVAARWAREVLLTDYNLACLERLQRHVELNRDGHVPALCQEKQQPAVAPAAGSPQKEEQARDPLVPALAREDGVKVRWLDWERIEMLPAAEEAAAGGGVRWHVGAAAEEDGWEEHEQHGVGDGNAFGRPVWGAGLLDVIIGSDVICDASCARGVAGLIAATLKPAAEGGVAYVTAPFPAHRYGVDAFPAELKAHGLDFEQEHVLDARLLADIPEAAYMSFHLYTITKPGGGVGCGSALLPRE